MDADPPPLSDPYKDSKVHPKLRRQVFDINEAVDLCLIHEPRLAIPALALLYAGMDGLAWVSIADGRLDVNGADFRSWVSQFLLPGSELQCDEHDLWAARCGIVHSQIMDSRHVRAKKARHLWYYVGPGNRLLVPIDELRHERPITISLPGLAIAFRAASERFFAVIEQNSDLANLVWTRANRYYDEVRIHGRPGDEGSWVETIPTVFG